MTQTVRRNTRNPRILLAEDDQELRALLTWVLHKAGYAITECSNGVELLVNLYPYTDSLQQPEFDLVVTDIRMPGLTALEIVEGLQDCPQCPPVILITSFGDDETHRKAERLGVIAVFDKPFDTDDLLSKVRQIVPIRKPEAASEAEGH